MKKILLGAFLALSSCVSPAIQNKEDQSRAVSSESSSNQPLIFKSDLEFSDYLNKNTSKTYQIELGHLYRDDTDLMRQIRSNLTTSNTIPVFIESAVYSYKVVMMIALDAKQSLSTSVQLLGGSVEFHNDNNNDCRRASNAIAKWGAPGLSIVADCYKSVNYRTLQSKISIFPKFIQNSNHCEKK